MDKSTSSRRIAQSSVHAPSTALPPTPKASQNIARLGGFAGIAVAAWFVTAVASGSGVATAETTGASSDSASSSVSASSGGASDSSMGPSVKSVGSEKDSDHADADESDVGKTDTDDIDVGGTEVDDSDVDSEGDDSKDGGTEDIDEPDGAGGEAVKDEADARDLEDAAVSSKSRREVERHVDGPEVQKSSTASVITPVDDSQGAALNPLMVSTPVTPQAPSPLLTGVLGWIQRTLFNRAPVIAENPTTGLQTGQTVTGNIGATDFEGDRLYYRITQGPRFGTLTIDQATGAYTYTPDDINYDAIQSDSFTVSVTDRRFNLLTFLRPHGDKDGFGITVLNPMAERTILNVPDGVTNPVNPRYTEDGGSIFFSATPTVGGRKEIYRIAVDGTDFECITCDVAPPPTRPGVAPNLGKPVPFTDGSGRLLVRVGDQGSVASGDWAVLEEDAQGNRTLIPIITPKGNAAAFSITPQREMRISPDGKHVAFSQLVLNANPAAPSYQYVGINAVVGSLTRTDAGYLIEDPRVIYPIGEVKQFTPDGKGVVILGGQYEIGNLDDVVVNLETGEVTRVTANLDYDEDMDYSPDQKWIAIGSTRTLDSLTPMTQIVRPGFLLPNIYGIVYEFYADPVNLSNQEWLVAAEDELKRENGIPLFVVDDPNTPADEGDGYTARSMPSWNPAGNAVVFWESNVDVDNFPTDTRIVIANLKYTTSGPAPDPDPVTPDYRAWNPPRLDSYVPEPPKPQLGLGTYQSGGGAAVVSEAPGSADFPYPGTFTTRTVQYTNYVNEDGLILNGSESNTTNGSQTYVGYRADITVTDAVTGETRGYLKANAYILTTQAGQIYAPGSFIRSELDGKELTLMDAERLQGAVQNA